MDEQGSAFGGLRESEEEATRASHQLQQEQDAAFLEALHKDKVLQSKHYQGCKLHLIFDNTCAEIPEQDRLSL